MEKEKREQTLLPFHVWKMRKASEGRVDPERGSGRLGGGTTYISVNAKSQSEAEWQIERVERR